MNELDEPLDDALDDVARRLDAELAGSLERTYVDVGSLRSGAVRRAGRVRAARRGVAAFVLVGAVAGVAVSSVLPRDSGRDLADGMGHGGHVAGVPASTGDPGAFVVDRPGTPVPTPTWTTPYVRRGGIAVTANPYDPRDPRSVAYVIPDSVAVDAAALYPPGRLARSDGDPSFAQFRLQTPLEGLDCDDFWTGGPDPVAARSWTWFDAKDDVHGLSVSETITGWDLGTGLDRLLDLAHNRGECTFPAGGRPTTVSTPGDWDRWEATAAPTKANATTTALPAHAYVVRRRGDVLVAIAVGHPESTAKALDLARSLCDQAVTRLEAAGLG